MDKWLENDTLVKIISVALAVVIWLQVPNPVTTATETQRTMHGVAVSWRNLPAELAVESVSPSAVDVQVRGANRQILNLDAGSVAAIVNLSGATAGRYQFYVDVSVPNGVQPVQVTPANVTVVLEPVIDRSKPVTVQVTGRPADGYQALTAVVTPAQVIVHGPQSGVDRVAGVLASVDVGGATADQVVTVTPKLVDAKGQVVSGVTAVPAQIQVTVPVRQAVATRTLPVTVTVTGKPATGYAVAGTTATPAAVTVSGPSATLDALTSVATAPVDVTGARSDVSTRAAIVLPDGVTSVQPGQVSVVVHIK
jgi:YbbR domain-containing protein